MTKLPIHLVVPSPRNPRSHPAPDQALVDSVKSHGVLEPILVRPLGDGRYEIVAGERRYRAAKMAGLTEVPAVIVEVDDRQAFEMAVAENTARRDLDPLEVLEAVLEDLRRRGHEDPETLLRRGINHLRRHPDSPLAQELREVARLLGISPHTLSHYAALLRIPAEIRRAVKGRNLSLKRLLRIAKNPEAVRRLQEVMERWRRGEAPLVPGLSPEESLWATLHLHLAPVLQKKAKGLEPKALNKIERLIWSLHELAAALAREGLLTERARETLEAFLNEAEEALLEADARLVGVAADFYYRAPREKLAATRKLLETARKREESGGEDDDDGEEELRGR
ncbi:ParB/RepB/Spo0J family partition protein [Fervidobacterium sp.]